MANHKVDPEKKVYAICGSVNIRAKKVLTAEASRQGITVAKLVGEVLEEWANGNGIEIEIDPNQLELEYQPYRRDGEEKEKREGREYRPGALGKEKGKDILSVKHRGNT